MVHAVGERDRSRAVRQAQGPPVGLPVKLLRRHGARPEEAQQIVGVERRPERQTKEDLPLHGLAPLSPTRRSSLGVAAKTSRMVSLNWRMLAKPAANATSEMGNSVVSMSSLAVWARRARASASGPAPTSAASRRWRWRSV